MSMFSKSLLRSICIGVLSVAVSVPFANAGDYHYGDTLDVAKVISINAPSPLACEVVTATMRYIDSKGNQRSVDFRQLSVACSASG